MMNVLAVFLVLTSLVTGVVWSPIAENSNQNQNQNQNKNPTSIVKEGHRVVVVEYERKGGDGTTKVVISPADDEENLSEPALATKGAVEDVKDKVKDAVNFRPMDIVCDALGKCKHKIATSLRKTKDKVSETVHGESEKVDEVEEHAKDTYEIAKDVVKKTHEGVEKVLVMAMDVGRKVKSFDAVDSPKRIGEDIEQNVSRIRESVKEMAKPAVEKGKKSLNKGREFAISYVLGITKWLDSVIDVVHLFGVSMAYGMTIFVSFVSSYVLSRTLTKQQFGMVQCNLYPVYHKGLGVCLGVGLLGHLFGQRRWVFSNNLEMFQAFALLAALLTVLGNSIFLEPRATKLMFERMKFDKEEGKGQSDDPSHGVGGGLGDPVCMSAAIGAVETEEEAGERHDSTSMTEWLKKLNMYSSFLNILTLILLSWHLVYLAQRLRLTR